MVVVFGGNVVILGCKVDNIVENSVGKNVVAGKLVVVRYVKGGDVNGFLVVGTVVGGG